MRAVIYWFESFFCVLYLLFLHSRIAESKDEWICNDGFWVDPSGEKSEYVCKDDEWDKEGNNNDEWNEEKEEKDNRCSTTEMLDTRGKAAVDSLYRTCITSKKDDPERCWWTFVPEKIKASYNSGDSTSITRLPLIIDMHGGGGCASDQILTSGFKELAEETGNFIIAYPQAISSLWASCGDDYESCAKEKNIANRSDIAFLEQLVSVMISRSNPWSIEIVEAEQIYVTGFSMGCMMAHRFAMERSNLVAGLACHGGELSAVGYDVPILENYLTRFDIQPMPVYLTIGTNDENWFNLAKEDFRVWSYWNGCNSNNETTTAIELSPVASSSKETSSHGTTVIRYSHSPCSSFLVESVLVEIQDGPHAPDSRMAELMWEYVREYKRPGASDVSIGRPENVSYSVFPTITAPSSSSSPVLLTLSVGFIIFSFFPLWTI